MISEATEWNEWQASADKAVDFIKKLGNADPAETVMPAVTGRMPRRAT